MTKPFDNEKLNKTFNLPKLEDVLPVAPPDDGDDIVQDFGVALAHADPYAMMTDDQHMDRIHHEMGEVAAEGMEKFRDLIDYAFNVEVKHSGDLFAAAASLHGNVIALKKAQMDARLKRIKLKMERQLTDQQLRKTAIDQPLLGASEDVIIEDRNKLIEVLRKKRQPVV